MQSVWNLTNLDGDRNTDVFFSLLDLKTFM